MEDLFNETGKIGLFQKVIYNVCCEVGLDESTTTVVTAEVDTRAKLILIRENFPPSKWRNAVRTTVI